MHPARALALFVPTVALVSLAMPQTSEARSKLGVQVQLSFLNPVSVYAESATLLQNVERGGVATSLPYIGDISNNGGIGIGLVITSRNLAFEYNLHVLPWGSAILHYGGDREATRSSSGQINDAGVTYMKLDTPAEEPNPVGEDDALSIQTFGASYRIYLSEGFFEPYIPVGGGIALASVSPNFSDRFGGYLNAGIAADLKIENIAFVFDLRYRYILTNNAYGTQQGSDVARVTGQSVLSALTSDLHMFTFDVGIHYSIN